MFVRKALSWGMTALAAVTFGACLGCGAGTPGSSGADPEAAHLGKVGGWAGDYAKANHAMPTNIDALKKWAKEKKGATDDDFVSLRDKKEYAMKVLSGGENGTCMIYEQEGEKHGQAQLVYKVNAGETTANKTDIHSIMMMRGSNDVPAGVGSPHMGGPGGGPGGGAGFHPDLPNGGGDKGQH
jgi:hypothetical protein